MLSRYMLRLGGLQSPKHYYLALYRKHLMTPGMQGQGTRYQKQALRGRETASQAEARGKQTVGEKEQRENKTEGKRYPETLVSEKPRKKCRKDQADDRTEY